jgi:hypothetical protein
MLPGTKPPWNEAEMEAHWNTLEAQFSIKILYCKTGDYSGIRIEISDPSATCRTCQEFVACVWAGVEMKSRFRVFWVTGYFPVQAAFYSADKPIGASCRFPETNQPNGLARSLLS